jgi:tRNA-dihydrouridine synthase A
MTRHIIGLFAGRPGVRSYRRYLATEAVRPGAGVQTLRAAVGHLERGSIEIEAAA